MTTMIKGLLFLSLLFLPLPALTALDIYLNGELWEHYPGEELADMVIPGEIRDAEAIEPVIPLRELLPLMSDWDSLEIRIPGGEILLEGDELAQRLDKSYMQQTPAGQWQIHTEQDIYTSPLHIFLQGTPDPIKSITVWAEPGLPQYQSLLEFWAALHKVDLIYKETVHLRQEIIHRKMTGEDLPDFTLGRLHPSDPFVPENAMSFLLGGAFSEEKGKQDRIILPPGKKAHPELFFSLMASSREYGSSPALLNETAQYYNELLARGIIQEKPREGDPPAEEGIRDFFFPAEEHAGRQGRRTSLPQLPGREEPPSVRVTPILLHSTGPAYREQSLQSFLLQKGIQYSLFDPEMRQLPADQLPEGLSAEYRTLYGEFQKGFILYEGNYTLWQNLQQRLPLLLIRNMDGVLDE